jgi:hypothetical protein
MAHALVLVGLVLGVAGSVCLVFESWGSDAAGVKWWIKEHGGNLPPGNTLQQVAFRAALRFGSDDPRDMQSYLVESFPLKTWGLCLLVFGFAFQAWGLVVGVTTPTPRPECWPAWASRPVLASPSPWQTPSAAGSGPRSWPRSATTTPSRS